MIDIGSKTGSDAEYTAGIEALAVESFDVAEGAAEHLWGGCFEGGSGVLLDGHEQGGT